MKKSYITIILIVLIGISASAQQHIRSNLYNLSRVQYNPATAGAEKELVAYMNVGRRWMEFEGAPRATQFGIHSGINGNMGLGLTVYNYKSGLIQNSNIYGQYSYTIALAQFQQLKFGIAAGVKRANLDMEHIQVETYDDPTLETDYYNKMRMNSSIGVQYTFDNLLVELASPEFLDDNYKFNRNIFALASYTIDLYNQDFQLMPSLMYQTSNNEFNQVDINCMLKWRDMAWAQVGYCTNKNLMFSAGVSYDIFKIGYGYEMTMADLSNASSGSHEIILLLDISTGHRKYYLKNKKYNSPIQREESKIKKKIGHH